MDWVKGLAKTKEGDTIEFSPLLPGVTIAPLIGTVIKRTKYTVQVEVTFLGAKMSVFTYNMQKDSFKEV